jgi:FkbM family methyltransferase
MAAGGGARSDRYRIARNGYGSYCVPLSSRHRPAAWAILAGEVWEPDTISFLTASCAGGDVVHAGAYFGDFLPALSRACGGTVWGFEPNPESYTCAVETARLNDLRNVTLANAALGARPGEVAMVTRDRAGRSLGGASRVAGDGDGLDGHAITVRTVTVDDVVPAHRAVSVVHLDVEGFETFALRGAIRTVRRWRPTLVLETMPDDSWFSENILALGYRVEGAVHENQILRCEARRPLTSATPDRALP